jgi:hypothetical protein
VCVLKWDVFSFGFLQVLSRIPLVVLGDHQGCPRHFAGSTFLIFIGSQCQGFAGSRFQIFIESIILKNHFMNFVKLNVLRVTGFLEFPNTQLGWRGQSHTLVLKDRYLRQADLKEVVLVSGRPT